jgi:hypothetical protein
LTDSNGTKVTYFGNLLPQLVKGNYTKPTPKNNSIGLYQERSPLTSQQQFYRCSHHGQPAVCGSGELQADSGASSRFGIIPPADFPIKEHVRTRCTQLNFCKETRNFISDTKALKRTD